MDFAKVIHFDRGDVLKHETTPEGFLNCYMRVAKVGDLKYQNADGSTRTEYVSPETLFNRDSVMTLKGKPITLEHPPQLLNSSTAVKYSKGSTGQIVVPEASFLGIVASIHDKPTIDAIRSGKAKEVSCGYTCDLKERKDGKFEQVNRRYNHVAVTQKGRAGNSVAVHMDSARKENVWTQVRGDSMSEELYQIDFMGGVTRVDAETYQLIQEERRDAAKKMSDMKAKMAKLRAMRDENESDDDDEDEDNMPKKDSYKKRKDAMGKSNLKAEYENEEDEEEDEDGDEAPVASKIQKARKDKKRKDAAKKSMKACADEEHEDDDDEEEDDSNLDRADSVDNDLLTLMLENQLLKKRFDAAKGGKGMGKKVKVAATEDEEYDDDNDNEPDDDEDDEDREDAKRKDAADVLNTWLAVSSELKPALVRGDSVVEGISVIDGDLRFDSVSVVDLKEAYIKLHGLSEVLSEANRYDSIAIDTAFEVVRKSQSVIGSKRGKATLDSALKANTNRRHDASDIRFASIQADIEAGRKRINSK
jgi:hypothetical protein